jgi:hypothetical protein
MESFFKDLGNAVLDRWKRENFSLEKFPQIAHTAIDKWSPAKRIKLPELIRDFLLRDDQPPQSDSPFGEPELVVYSHSRFYIQLLFWMDGTTAIHQHEFSGAFHVMHGSSVHAHYEFEKVRPITPYIRTGNLKMKNMALLEAGRTVPIVSGQQTIHSLFHLDSPSVTVVVRTQHDPGTGPQFNYLPPHVSVDPHYNDGLMMRRRQLLDVLEQSQNPGYADLVMEMIQSLDFERGFHVLQNCIEYLQELDAWESTIKAFEKKHGVLATGVAATLKEDRRRGIIKGFRGSITEPEHRFFLALLMSAPTRADLLKLVTQRYPKKPPMLIVMRWIEELTEFSELSVSILDAEFPESLEVEPDAQPDLFLSAFGYFFKREKMLPTAMDDLSQAQVKQLRSAFADSALGLLIC